MGDPRPPPILTGERTDEHPIAPSRYVMTYDGIGDTPTDGNDDRVVGEEADASFRRWLLEWMLAWTEDPSVMRVDSDPNGDACHGRILVEVDPSDTDLPRIGSPCCDASGRHHRLIRELDRRVENLVVRCEPRVSAPAGSGSERNDTTEVFS